MTHRRSQSWRMMAPRPRWIYKKPGSYPGGPLRSTPKTSTAYLLMSQRSPGAGLPPKAHGLSGAGSKQAWLLGTQPGPRSQATSP